VTVCVSERADAVNAASDGRTSARRCSSLAGAVPRNRSVAPWYNLCCKI